MFRVKKFYILLFRIASGDCTQSTDDWPWTLFFFSETLHFFFFFCKSQHFDRMQRDCNTKNWRPINAASKVLLFEKKNHIRNMFSHSNLWFNVHFSLFIIRESYLKSGVDIFLQRWQRTHFYFQCCLLLTSWISKKKNEH